MTSDAISDLISTLGGYVWGPPLMVLLVGTGLYLSARLRLIQFRGFWHAISHLRRGPDARADDPGEISPFRALATALSATVGTGNIVGVSAAILAGGPGAVFWMWITALVGMATKFASCTLAVMYRRIDRHGEAHGGPMYYIEQGMGPRWKWLAVMFALFTALASFGIGNMFQANSVAAAVNTLISGHEESSSATVNLVTGLAMAGLVALVILGGIKRIAAFAARLVPAMCAFYLVAGVVILVRNAGLIPDAFGLILHHAFHAPESVAGGLLGGVIRQGVARGLFSNEAGLGSAAMAHAAAQTRQPVRQGLVAMLGPFIDTIIICSMTALVIICSGLYQQGGITKAKLTSAAFEAGLPGSGALVAVGVILFAFSTMVSWSYYGDRATEYLLGPRAVTPYRWLYVGFVLLGPVVKLTAVINFSDLMNGLMAVPNLVAVIVLAPVLARAVREYFRDTAAG